MEALQTVPFDRVVGVVFGGGCFAFSWGVFCWSDPTCPVRRLFFCYVMVVLWGAVVCGVLQVQKTRRQTAHMTADDLCWSAMGMLNYWVGSGKFLGDYEVSTRPAHVCHIQVPSWRETASFVLVGSNLFFVIYGDDVHQEPNDPRKHMQGCLSNTPMLTAFKSFRQITPSHADRKVADPPNAPTHTPTPHPPARPPAPPHSTAPQTKLLLNNQASQ